MSEFMDVIKTRRSIRKFEDKAIPDDVLQEVLEAARWSQSWANSQCWELVVIKDQTVKDKAQAAVGDRNPANAAVAAAPVVIAVCAHLKRAGYYGEKALTKFGDWFMFDLGIVTQNITLAARSLGLGSVVVGALDQDQAAAAVKIPDDHELVVLIPMGYPDQEAVVPERRPIGDFVHQDTF